MKKYKLKKWVKIAIAVMIVWDILLLTIMLFKKIDNNFVEKCTSAGYSETYCIAHK